MGLGAAHLPYLARRLLDQHQDPAGTCQQARPASVNSTWFLVRWKRETPSSRSSFRICWLKAGWDRYIRPAARLKFNSSATATKYLKFLRSIFGSVPSLFLTILYPVCGSLRQLRRTKESLYKQCLLPAQENVLDIYQSRP
jgi:hypothetical protein